MTSKLNIIGIFFLFLSLFTLSFCTSGNETGKEQETYRAALSELITINALKVSDSLKLALFQESLAKYKISSSQMYIFLTKNKNKAAYWQDTALNIKQHLEEEQKQALKMEKKTPEAPKNR